MRRRISSWRWLDCPGAYKPSSSESPSCTLVVIIGGLMWLVGGHLAAAAGGDGHGVAVVFLVPFVTEMSHQISIGESSAVLR